MLASDPAAAHQDPDLKVHEIARRIAADQGNAGLYLLRGQLHRIQRNWTAAISDFQTAHELDPQLRVVDLAVAETLLDAGNTSAALTAAGRYVAAMPEDAAGHRVLARALAAGHKHADAAASFSRAIELAGRTAAARAPQPDDYLGRARSLAALGSEHLAEAIRGLDEGLVRLHGAITLELLAIELELAREHWDGALARIAGIEAQARRKEAWLARRGEILQAAGRTQEARAAFEAALAAIAALPPHLRTARATSELSARLRTQLSAANVPQQTRLARCDGCSVAEGEP